MNGKIMPKTKIFDWLYLGDHYDAINIAEHPNSKIKEKWKILNVLEKELQEDKIDEEIIPILYKTVDGKYHLDWNQVFKAGDWIEKTRIENPKLKILCRCGAGQERSPLVVAYYLVRYYNMSPDNAYRFIQAMRPEVMRCDLNYIW